MMEVFRRHYVWRSRRLSGAPHPSLLTPTAYNAGVLLIIDGNNMAWAGFYALERAMKPEDYERRQRVALLGVASTVLGAIARSGTPPGEPIATLATSVAVCFDEGRPLRRREVYPPYQTGREGDPKFIQNEPTILRAIAAFREMAAAMLPVDVLRGANTEADDLIAGLIDANPDIPKRIVSTDRDFLQLIGPNTSVYAPVKRIIIDERNFFDAFGLKAAPGAEAPFPRDRFLDFRALNGDPSDNLPGVPGIGPLSAAKLLALAPLDTFFGHEDAVREALGRKNLAVEMAFGHGNAREIVERNRALMDLRLPAPCWAELPALTVRGAWDRARFDEWFTEQKISAVDRDQLFERLEALAAPEPRT